MTTEENAGVRSVPEPYSAPLATGSLRSLRKAISLAGILFLGSLAIYATTRLYALERFPIYFFGDEAVQVLFAQDLIAQNFHAQDSTLLPIYVEAAGNRWTPLLHVLHALTLTLFGKSIG
jgi:hypothetical protein